MFKKKRKKEIQDLDTLVNSISVNTLISSLTFISAFCLS